MAIDSFKAFSIATFFFNVTNVADSDATTAGTFLSTYSSLIFLALDLEGVGRLVGFFFVVMAQSILSVAYQRRCRAPNIACRGPNLRLISACG